jgi:hypothetical protein
MSDRNRLTCGLWNRLVRELWLLRCALGEVGRTPEKTRAICQKTRQVLAKSRKLAAASRRYRAKQTAR